MFLCFDFLHLTEVSEKLFSKNFGFHQVKNVLELIIDLNRLIKSFKFLFLPVWTIVNYEFTWSKLKITVTSSRRLLDFSYFFGSEIPSFLIGWWPNLLPRLDYRALQWPIPRFWRRFVFVKQNFLVRRLITGVNILTLKGIWACMHALPKFPTQLINRGVRE